MNGHPKSFVRQNLTPHEYLIAPLRVPMGAYAQFSDWMDGELRKLVARWGHLAPPRQKSQNRENRDRARP
jgi:hypothetical protein